MATRTERAEFFPKIAVAGEMLEGDAEKARIDRLKFNSNALTAEAVETGVTSIITTVAIANPNIWTIGLTGLSSIALAGTEIYRRIQSRRHLGEEQRNWEGAVSSAESRMRLADIHARRFSPDPASRQRYEQIRDDEQRNAARLRLELPTYRHSFARPTHRLRHLS